MIRAYWPHLPPRRSQFFIPALPPDPCFGGKCRTTSGMQFQAVGYWSSNANPPPDVMATFQRQLNEVVPPSSQIMPLGNAMPFFLGPVQASDGSVWRAKIIGPSIGSGVMVYYVWVR